LKPKADLAGSEGAQGGNKERRIELDYVQNLEVEKDAKIGKLRDELEERKDKI